MGAMSRLHLLGTNVIEGRQTIEEAASGSTFTQEDIEWAIEEIRKA